MDGWMDGWRPAACQAGRVAAGRLPPHVRAGGTEGASWFPWLEQALLAGQAQCGHLSWRIPDAAKGTAEADCCPGHPLEFIPSGQFFVVWEVLKKSMF